MSGAGSASTAPRDTSGEAMMDHGSAGIGRGRGGHSHLPFPPRVHRVFPPSHNQRTAEEGTPRGNFRLMTSQGSSPFC